jgi:hypothetical protein
MKQLIATFVLVAAVAQFAQAQSVTVSDKVVNQYLLNNNVVVSDNWANQLDIFTAFDGGYSLDFRYSRSLSGDAGARELDGSGSKVTEVNGVLVDTGFLFMDFVPTMDIEGTDIGELWVELRPVDGIEADIVPMKLTATPYVRTETLRDLGDGDLVNFETMSYIGLKYNGDFGHGVSANGKLSAAYDPGILGVEPGFLVIYEESLNFKLQSGVTVTPFWVKLVDKVTGNKDFNAAFGASVAATF